MTDAEATIKQSILMGMTDEFRATPEKTVDNILKRLFEPHVIWSIKEYLIEKEVK
jgi:hypothetical protein